MTKRTRNFLFYFFVFLFFVITPFAIFYAAGYKINFSWPIKINSFLQKTGMLVLSTEPKNASIYLNDSNPKNLWDTIFLRENRTMSTPIKIKGLLPGEYDVRLELEGYWPWQKKLSIHPEPAPIQENILLFKKDLPLQVLEMTFDEGAETNWLSISSDKKSIACANQDNLKIFDISSETISSWKITNPPEDERDLLWSPDGQKIILQEKIYNTVKNELINLSEIIYQNIFNVKWSETNSSQIYYQYGNNLNLFD